MTAPALCARGLRAERAGHLALDGVDLDVATGTLTVIVGATGSGKSTLLDVLAGTREPAAGRVVTGGRTRAVVPRHATFTDPLSLSVRDLIMVGAWARRGPEGLTEAACTATVDDAMRRLALRSRAQHAFSSLPDGHRQRALLAQGLARGADIVLLDEPTAGLDPVSAARIRAALVDETRCGASVVCASQDERLIRDADQLIELEGGRVRSATRSIDRGRRATSALR